MYPACCTRTSCAPCPNCDRQSRDERMDVSKGYCPQRGHQPSSSKCRTDRGSERGESRTPGGSSASEFQLFRNTSATRGSRFLQGRSSQMVDRDRHALVR
ncbi:hypothetical protein ARMGADRAFT_1062062 [Armillaria gallica]|uniref:Uncharacterized protein n=1 Tax=Armillaria gallica TaxID=47427 RepID=A0A2H3E2A5_ARMGA|nr:hypothetical protein ARMGADRAFT_1062062 [Armillaria gallica]